MLLIKKALALSWMLALSLTAIIVPSYWLSTEVDRQRSLLESGYHLIVTKSYHGYWPGSVVIGMGLLLATIGLVIYQYKPKLYPIILKASTYICIVGIGALLAGPFTASLYWSQVALARGYTQCDDYPLLGRDRVHMNIWSKDPATCDDSRVARMLSSTSDEDLLRVHRLIESEQGVKFKDLGFK